MKSTLSQCALSLWENLNAPLIRHECDHRCGLYKNKKSTYPLASFEFHRDSSVPIMKLIAVLSGMVLVCIFVKKITSRVKRCRVCNFTCTDQHSNCE